jgi:hypothetical protein
MCLGDALGVVIIDHTTYIKMCAADRKKNYDGVRVRVNEGLVSMRRSTQQSLNSQRGLGLPSTHPVSLPTRPAHTNDQELPSRIGTAAA